MLERMISLAQNEELKNDLQMLSKVIPSFEDIEFLTVNIQMMNDSFNEGVAQLEKMLRLYSMANNARNALGIEFPDSNEADQAVNGAKENLETIQHTIARWKELQDKFTHLSTVLTVLA